jgi:hypothetical protein
MKRTARAGMSAGGTLLALMLGCGGGGGGGAASSTIRGNLASAPDASIQPLRKSWLAWAEDEILGVARRAFAQSSDLGGVEVRATAVDGSSASDSTDDRGDFEVRGSPTGNVTVIFSRGRCQGEVILPDMSRDAVVTLEDVDFDCTGARPAKVEEAFRGVIRNVPSSPNGNLNVCVAAGAGRRTRVVKLNDTAIQDANGTPTSFNNLAEGQLIEASGEREGLGASSALDAETVKILGEGNRDDCGGQSTPTPAVTETPEPTATGTQTAVPTPTQTP